VKQISCVLFSLKFGMSASFSQLRNFILDCVCVLCVRVHVWAVQILLIHVHMVILL